MPYIYIYILTLSLALTLNVSTNFLGYYLFCALLSIFNLLFFNITGHFCSVIMLTSIRMDSHYRMWRMDEVLWIVTWRKAITRKISVSGEEKGSYWMNAFVGLSENSCCLLFIFLMKRHIGAKNWKQILDTK